MGDGQDLADRADRKETEQRMRRGEPAPTAERARVEAELARRILAMWWTPWVWLGLAAVWALLVLFQDDVVGRALSVWVILNYLGMAVWRELHRRGAARLLDANRQRWGEL